MTSSCVTSAARSWPMVHGSGWARAVVLQSATVGRLDTMSRTISRTRPTKLATLDAVEEVARRVPGYRGYQEPSQRREDDLRFRSSIAEHLRSEAHRLEHIEN